MDNDNWNPNAPIVCPYDPLHVVSVKRFQGHLIKCRKNHVHKDFVTCPFNAQHLFLRDQLKSHLANCPDRVILDADVIQATDPETGEIRHLKGNTSMPTTRYRIPECNEDWDGEIEENISIKMEQQEFYLRRQGFKVSGLPQDLDNESIASETSRLSDISSSSSVYVQPIKRSEQYKVNKERSRYPIDMDTPSHRRETTGRGALLRLEPIATCGQTFMNNDTSGFISPITGIGRGSLISHTKTKEQNLKGFGRGVIKQTVMQFKES